MSRDRRKKSGVSLICLIIWVVAAVALVIMFLANKKRIFGNLKATGFFERVFGSTPKFIEDAEVPEEKIAKNETRLFPKRRTLWLTQRFRRLWIMTT